MNFRITQVKPLFSLILTIILLLGSTGCGSQPASTSDTATIEPEPGNWVAEFSIDTNNGEIENWLIGFVVSDDGKTVPFIQFAHYIGELTSGTNVYLSASNAPIEKNSFEISLFEHISGSQHDYEGIVTFTSAKEADGTLNINGIDHQFTAAWSSKK